MRSRTPLLVTLVACFCAAPPLEAARAQDDASRTSAFVARGDLVSAELTAVDAGRQVATTVTVNAYSGLAFPGDPGHAMPRRLVVVLDRRRTATGVPTLFAVGTASNFQLDSPNPGSATLRAVVPLYALDGRPLFDVRVELGWTADEGPRAIHWVNPFNVPGFSSVFHALDGASEASVEGRVAFGDVNFSPERGHGVLALGARVIVGMVPRGEPGRALAEPAPARPTPSELPPAPPAAAPPAVAHAGARAAPSALPPAPPPTPAPAQPPAHASARPVPPPGAIGYPTPP